MIPSPDLPRALTLSTGEAIPYTALEFATSRSGGPGGQNVNKVETRVEVRLQIRDSPWLRPNTQQRILDELQTRIDSSGAVRVVSSTERSQHANRTAAVERLRLLLNAALTPRTPRKATRPTRASKRRRVEAKKQQSEKKQRRRWKP